MDVELRSVEGGFPAFFFEVHIEIGEYVTHDGFGAFPFFAISDEFFAIGIAEREARLETPHAQLTVVEFVHIDHAAEFIFHLVGGTVDVRIVHAHRAHAQ